MQGQSPSMTGIYDIRPTIPTVSRRTVTEEAPMMAMRLAAAASHNWHSTLK